jgi:chromate reductase, NAD(P)H dehydrogenase (quinone)
MTITIAGIAGSLRRGSFNRALLLAAAYHLPPGAELAVWDGLRRVPPFSEDAEAGRAPAGVAELRRVIGDADGLLIATPEYNGSVPGQLKNALDWASRPRGAAALDGKPTAVISASPTPYGAAWAQADLRKILGIASAELTAAGLAVPRAPTQFTLAGQLADPVLRDRLAVVITELAQRAAALATRQAA